MHTPTHPLHWILIAAGGTVVAGLIGVAVKIGSDTASYLEHSTVMSAQGVETASPNPFVTAPASATVADTSAETTAAAQAEAAAQRAREDAADLARPSALVAAAN